MVYPYDEVEAVIFGPACRHSHERRLNFQVAGLIPLRSHSEESSAELASVGAAGVMDAPCTEAEV
jgi:hypothetical protein